MDEENYEIYRTVRSKDEFYSRWEDESLDRLSDERKDRIYQKYVVKCAVFQRDGFKCQNEACKTPESPLTMHHIRFQKNNGVDKLKNCVTICKSCHKGFHRGKSPLAFWGHTYRTHIEEGVDWKQVRKATKEIRKGNRELWGMRISPMLVALLLDFLFREWEEDDLYEEEV